MVIGFIDLDKACDTLPCRGREISKAPLRWMVVAESEIRMVGGTHEDTKSRVLC